MNTEEIGNNVTVMSCPEKKSLHLISFLQEYLQDGNILLFADNF